VALTLSPGADVSALETRVAGVSPPLNVKLRVRFKPGDAEQAFDFTFPNYSGNR
jgi:hypothetical protein